ncbi:hypothetical protein ABH944_000597 [Caballeronia udeis]|jgi:hypothetical protein|uniref:Uncharacterized protein n=1 Tax=Caballeronia udeis TaxID=1232866 RepID=A0ABW8ME47_9BURK
MQHDVAVTLARRLDEYTNQSDRNSNGNTAGFDRNCGYEPILRSVEHAYEETTLYG